MVFQQNLLEIAYYIAKMSDLAMARPASSDFWKAPLVMVHYNRVLSVLYHCASFLWNARCCNTQSRRNKKVKPQLYDQKADPEKLHLKESNCRSLQSILKFLIH